MRKKGTGKLQKTMHLLALTGTVLSMLAAMLSALAGLFVVRLFRYIDTAQRTLPTLEKAAKVYLEKNGIPMETAQVSSSKGREPREKKP